ncbi:MAG: phosphoglucomutase/phosphomannomutase family protein [Trueperaceae bacterium]|nr:phosphoglucomutase/phosphomannomutase family protein [Trueperaceae bacterium]
MDELRFGTDGWRDRIGERFTTDNVRRAAHATAGWLRDADGRRVVVAHDTRFAGPMFARAAAETLAAHGLEVHLADGPLPTPVLSFAVRHLGADAGVMLTASHNPPLWNGFKLKGAYGGTATQEIYAEVAARTARTEVGAAPPYEPGRHALRPLDVREAYFEQLAGLLDLDLLRDLEGTLVHDAMGGTAGGWLSGFARHAGLTLRVETLRGTPDPMFYGGLPEPVPAQTTALQARMQRGDAYLGTATDGDGDRLAGVLPGGRTLNSHEIFALLLDQRHRAGGRGRVAVTFTVSRLVERLAGRRGLEVRETPVGFKWLVEEMRAGGVLIAGEESGGIGVPEHLPERDGIANTLFLLQACAEAGDAPPGADGGALGARLDALQREADWRHAYDRVDLPLEGEAAKARLQAALDADPDRFAGREVTSVERLDGVKLNLAGKAWLMFRASGTEPVLRVYCEAQTHEEVRTLLAEARTFAEHPPA